MKPYQSLLSIFILFTIMTCVGCAQKNTSASSDAEVLINDEESSTVMETTATPETTTIDSTSMTTSSAKPDVNEYVRVRDYIPDIEVELKYATADNFTGQIIYDFTDAYLRYGTVLKLKNAQDQLKEQGYRIKIWDAYRPFYAQQLMWTIYPDVNYVANPSFGPLGHNLGATMDITLVTLDGKDVLMPTEFDNFSTLADRNYSEVDPLAAKHALLLESIMTANDFTGYSGEWWDYTDNTKYQQIDDFIPAN